MCSKYARIADKEANMAIRQLHGLKNNVNDTEEELAKYREEYMKHWKMAWKQQIKLLDMGLTQAKEYGDLIDVLQRHGFTVKKGDNMLTGKWFWITLRPAAEHNERFDSFKEQVREYIKRKMFLGWTYAFEQKGETEEEMGKGYHVHIIAECTNNMNKAKVIRDTKSSWKQWLGGDCPDAFIQVEKMEKQTEYQNRLKYITEKKGESYKHAAQEIDKIWRKQKKLYDTYSHQ